MSIKTRMVLRIAALALIAALWVTPVYSVSAAEEGDSYGESEGGTPQGAGAIILMVGLGSVGLVGFMYSSRQTNEEATE